MGKGNQKNLVKKKKQNVFRALFRRIDALTASITLLVKDKLRPAAAPAAPPAEPLRVSRSRSESMSSCFGAPSRRIAEPAPCVSCADFACVRAWRHFADLPREGDTEAWLAGHGVFAPEQCPVHHTVRLCMKAHFAVQKKPRCVS